MSKLPNSEHFQRLLISALVNCPGRPELLTKCADLGITDRHFQEPELILWREIHHADLQMRPFDFNALSNHLIATRNGAGEKLADVLTNCVEKNGMPESLAQYCEDLIEIQNKRDAWLAANYLMEAVERGGDEWLDELERVQNIGRKEARSLPPMVSARQLCLKPPPRPPEIIEGILHQGSKMALGGGSKSFKTWTLLELAICVASGREWLGFATAAGKVLYLNFELPEFSIEERVSAICKAMGIEVPENLILWNLRGHAADASTILPIISREASKKDFRLIVLDPLYKLLGGRDENAAHDMADLMNQVERLTVDTKASVVSGSHFAKGNASGKESMDRISGSGVFARDPDSIVTMTAHKQAGAFTVEMTLRNFPPQEAFVVRREHPLMVVDRKLDPAELKPAAGRKQEITCDDVTGVLGDDTLSYAEWLKRAEESIFISPATFKRRLAELKKTRLIMQSAVDEGKYAKA